MSTFRLLGFLVLALLSTGSGRSAGAQDIGPATTYARWTVTPPSAPVAPGGTAAFRFEVSIADGWKMYAMDSPRPSRGVEIQFDDLPPGLARAGDVRQKAPQEGFDPNFNIDVRYFEGSAWFEAGLAVAPEAEPGRRTVSGRVVFMICNDRLCLPPTRVPFEETVTVAAAGKATSPSATPDAPPAGAEEATPEEGVAVPDLTAGQEPLAGEADAAVGVIDDDYASATAGGIWTFLLLAMGAGLAALLTPCVFPMIPLTVSYFTQHADDRSTSVRMASVYGLSIVLTFTALGVVTALIVGAAGAQTIAANPWLNLSIGVIFIIFALSLLGLFELRLPNGLLNYFNQQSHAKGGYLGVLFMGLTLTLVSFSCTAPFVGGLLAATTRDEWAYPVLGMLAFSATFALPFVLFALFPKGLSALPKSGAWMNTVKVTLGFVELAAALKFLSNADLIWGWGVFSRPLAISAIVVLFFMAGLYLIGKLPLRNEPPPQEVGVVQLLFAVLFFGLSLYMLPGLFGAPLNSLDAYLPPRMATDVSLVAALPRGGDAADHDEGWHEDVEAAFAEAAASRKPVFIDFTGYTCTNCRQMEANVFPRAEVARRFARDYVLLRLYTDDADLGPDLQRYQLQLTGTVALPTYAVVEPFGRTLLARLSGVASTEAFAAFLDRGTTAFQNEALADAGRAGR